MPFSPIVSIIRCPSPNARKTIVLNRNYAHYIATRPGVDLSSIHSMLDAVPSGSMPDAGKTEDLFQECQEADNETYASYIANRPRSHGMFGNIDTSDLTAVGREITRLTETHRNIYRGILSLGEKDAKLLGMTSSAAWNGFMCATLPDVAKTLGMSPTDFTWIAAFHAEEGHPHVHYMLWDNRDRVCSNYIHVSKQKHCRQIFSENLFTEEYEKLVRELTQAERNEYSLVRNENRKNITEGFQSIFDGLPNYVPGTEADQLPPRVDHGFMESLSSDLQELAGLLPGHGSFKYKYMNSDPQKGANIKALIDHISDKVLKHTELSRELESYLESKAALSRLVGRTKEDIEYDVAKDKQDIYSRTGNIILKSMQKLMEQHYFESITASNILDSSDSTPPDAGMFEDIYDSDTPSFSAMEAVHDNPGASFQEDGKTIEMGEFEYKDTDITFQDFKDFGNSDDYPVPTDNAQSSGYSMEWTLTYKNALHELYHSKNPDYRKILSLLQQEAATKNVLAIYDLGKLYEKGLFGECDPDIFERYYKEAFHGFHKIRADLLQGVSNLRPDKQAKKLDYSAYRIGKMYHRGQGTDTDYEKAAQYYRLSGNKYAQYSLGKIYQENLLPEEPEKDSFAIAVSLFKKSHAQGNPFASYELGKLCDTGELAENPFHYYQEALYGENGFLKMASDSSDDMLFYRIGKMYLNGKGCDVNEKEAYEYLEQSAKLNNEYAIYALIQRDLKTEHPDFATIISSLEKLCKNENSFAQYTLAKIYLNQDLDYYNLDRGIELLKKSAELENDHAFYALGALYRNPDLPEIYNPQTSFDYWMKSAELGNGMAMYQIGKCHADHLSPDFDLDTAIQWFQKSDAADNEHASYALGKIYMEPSYPELFNPEKAMHYWLRSAELGNSMAMYQIGKCYADNLSPDFNLDTAIQWFEKSDAADNEFASYTLGKIYMDPSYPKHFNPEKAMTYWLRSAELGNSMAMYQIGKCYTDSNLPYYNVTTAMEWLERSADEENSFAQIKLGIMHLYGKDIPKNREIGICWIQKAIGNDNELAQEVLENYLKFEQAAFLQAAYSVFSHISSALFQSNYQKQGELEIVRLNSKQAKKEAFRKSQIHGAELE